MYSFIHCLLLYNQAFSIQLQHKENGTNSYLTYILNRAPVQLFCQSVIVHTTDLIANHLLNMCVLDSKSNCKCH